MEPKCPGPSCDHVMCIEQRRAMESPASCAVCRSAVGPTVCAACHREERAARERAERRIVELEEKVARIVSVAEE